MSCVEETNVVARVVLPFHLTVELLTKPVPFTVKVNCGDPARHELGLIDVIVGTGFAANALLTAANTIRNGRIFLTGKS